MAETNLEQLMLLITLICCIQEGTGATTSLTTYTAQANSIANITFNINFEADETIVGTSNFFFGTSKIADRNGATLIPVPSYSSRLTAYGTSGISLSQVTDADAGTYTYTVTISPGANPFTATATLSVQGGGGGGSGGGGGGGGGSGGEGGSTSSSSNGIGGLCLGHGAGLGVQCCIILALLAMLANAIA